MIPKNYNPIRFFYYSTLALTVLAFSLGIYWLFKPMPETKLVLKTAPKNQATIVRSDLDWSKLKEDELRSIYEQVSNPKNKNQHEWTATLKFGETIVSSGYEVKPGQYIFSKITPVQASKDGRVVIQNTLFSTSIAGEVENIVNGSMEMVSGDVKGWGGGSIGGAHIANVRVKFTKGTNEVTIKVSETFYPDKKKDKKLID